MSDPAEWVGPAIAALTLSTLGIVAVRGCWRFFRKAANFLNDVSGEAARPGRPARPGLVEQVSRVVAKQDAMAVRQEEIAAVAHAAAEDASAAALLVRKELTRNGGESTKDKVHQALRASERNSTMLETLVPDPPPMEE